MKTINTNHMARPRAWPRAQWQAMAKAWRSLAYKDRDEQRQHVAMAGDALRKGLQYSLD